MKREIRKQQKQLDSVNLQIQPKLQEKQYLLGKVS